MKSLISLSSTIKGAAMALFLIITVVKHVLLRGSDGELYENSVLLTNLFVNIALSIFGFLKRKRPSGVRKTHLLIVMVLFSVSSFLCGKMGFLLPVKTVAVIKQIKVVVIYSLSLLFLNVKFDVSKFVGSFLMTLCTILYGVYFKTTKKTDSGEKPLSAYIFITFSWFLSGVAFFLFDFLMKPNIKDSLSYIGESQLLQAIIYISFLCLSRRERELLVSGWSGWMLNWKVQMMFFLNLAFISILLSFAFIFDPIPRLITEISLALISDFVADIITGNDKNFMSYTIYFCCFCGIVIFNIDAIKKFIQGAHEKTERVEK